MTVSLLFRNFIQGVMLTVLLGVNSAKAEVADPPIIIAVLPKYFIGAWRVKSVRINVQDGRGRGLEFNDPELMGRRFWFSEQDLAYNTVGASHCIKPEAFKWVGEANKLLESTMGKRGLEEPYQLAAVEDFFPSAQRHKIIEAFILTCSSGYVGPGSFDLPYPLNTRYFGSWVTLLNKDEMAMKWYGRHYFAIAS